MYVTVFIMSPCIIARFFITSFLVVSCSTLLAQPTTTTTTTATTHTRARARQTKTK
jgi:hypothetical protein